MAIFKRKHAGTATTAPSSRKPASASASASASSGSGSSSDDDSDIVVSALPAKSAPAPRKSGPSASSKATKQGTASVATTAKKQQAGSKEPAGKGRGSIEGPVATGASKKRRLEEPSPPPKKRSRKDDVALQLQEENEYTVGSSSNANKKQKTDKKSPSKSGKADQQTSKKRPKNRYYEPPEDIEDEDRPRKVAEQSVKPKKKARDSVERAGRKERESARVSDNASSKKASTTAGPTKPSKVQAKRLSETVPTAVSKKRRRESVSSSPSFGEEEQPKAAAASSSRVAEEDGSSDSDIVAAIVPSKKASTSSTKATQQPPLKKKATSTATASPAKTAQSAAKAAKAPTHATKSYEPYHDSDSEDDVEIIPSIASAAKLKAQASTSYMAPVAPAPIKATSGTAAIAGRRSSLAKKYQSPPLQPTVVIPVRKVSTKQSSVSSVDKPSKASGSARPRPSTTTTSQPASTSKPSASRPSSTKRKSVPAPTESISSNNSEAADSHDEEDIVVAVPVTKKTSPEKVKKPRASLSEVDKAEERKSKVKAVPTPVRKPAKLPPRAAVSSEEEEDELEDDSDTDELAVATVPASSKKGSAKKLSNTSSRPSSSSKPKLKADKNRYVPAFQDIIPGLSDNEDLYPSSDENAEADQSVGNTSSKSKSKSNKGKQPAEEEEDYRPAASTIPPEPSRRPSLRKSDVTPAVASSSKSFKRASPAGARFSVEVIGRKPSIRKSEVEQKASTSASKPRKHKVAPAPVPPSHSESESEEEVVVATSAQTKAKEKSRSLLNKARKKSTIPTPLQSQAASLTPSPSPPATTSKTSKTTKATKAKASVADVQEIDSSATESEPEEDQYILPPPLSFSRLSEMAEDANRMQNKAPVRADSDGSDDEMLLSPDKPASPQRSKDRSTHARVGSSSRASTSSNLAPNKPSTSAKPQGSPNKTRKPRPATTSPDIEEAAPEPPAAASMSSRSPSVEDLRLSPKHHDEPNMASPDVTQDLRSLSPDQQQSAVVREFSPEARLPPESARPQSLPSSSSDQVKAMPEANDSSDDDKIVQAKQSKPTRAKPNAARKTTRPKPVQAPAAVTRQSASPTASSRSARSDTTEPAAEQENIVVVTVIHAETTVIDDDSDASAGIFSEAEGGQGEDVHVGRTVVTAVERSSDAEDRNLEVMRIDTIAIERSEQEGQSNEGLVADAIHGGTEVEVDPLPSHSEESRPLRSPDDKEEAQIDATTSEQPNLQSTQSASAHEEGLPLQPEQSLQTDLRRQGRDESEVVSETDITQATVDTEEGSVEMHEPILDLQEARREPARLEPPTAQAGTLPVPGTPVRALDSVDQDKSMVTRDEGESDMAGREGGEPHSAAAVLSTVSSTAVEVRPQPHHSSELLRNDRDNINAADNAIGAAEADLQAEQEDRVAIIVQTGADDRARSVEEVSLRSSHSASTAALEQTPEVQSSGNQARLDDPMASADITASTFQPAELGYDGDTHFEDIPVPDIADDEVDESLSNELANSSQSRSPAPASSKVRRPRKSKVGAAKSINDNIPVPSLPNEYGDDDDEFGLPPELQSGLEVAEDGHRSSTQDSANEHPSRTAKKPAARRRTREWEKVGTPMKTEDESGLTTARPKRDTKKAIKSSTVLLPPDKKRERPVRSLSPGKPAPLGFSRGISRGIRKSLAETYSDDDDEDTVTVAKSSTLVNASQRKSEEKTTEPTSHSRNASRYSESMSNGSENRSSMPPVGYNDEPYMDNDNFDYGQSSFIDPGTSATQGHMPFDSNKPTLQSVRNRRVVNDDGDDDTITVAASTSARYQPSPDFDDSMQRMEGDTKAAASPQTARGISRRTFGGASKTNKRAKRSSPRHEADISDASRHASIARSESYDFEHNDMSSDGPSASTSGGPYKARKSRLSLQILSEYEVIEPDDVQEDQNDVTVYILEEHEEFEFEMDIDEKDEGTSQASQNDPSRSLQPPLEEIRRAVANSNDMETDSPSIAALRKSSSGSQTLIGEETTPSARKVNGTFRPGAFSGPTEGRRPRKAPATYREDSIVPETSVEPSNPSEGEEDAEGDPDPAPADADRFSEAKLDHWMSTFTDVASATIAETELAKLFTAQMMFPLVKDKSVNSTDATSSEDFRANLDPHLMLLGWQLQSPSIHTLSRDKFRDYMLDEMIDSPERLQQYLQNLWETVFPRVQSRKGAEAAEDAEPVDLERIPKRYFGFYDYVYGIIHDSETHDYPFEAVIATWSCILASYSTVGDDLLEFYTDVLSRDSLVTEELWISTLKFVDAVTFADKDRLRIKGYIADAYDWPDVIKDYVKWVKDGRQPLPVKDDFDQQAVESEQDPTVKHDIQQQTTVQEASDEEMEAVPTVISAPSLDSATQQMQEEHVSSMSNSQNTAAEKAIEEATQEAMAQAEADMPSKSSDANVLPQAEADNEVITQQVQTQVDIQNDTADIVSSATAEPQAESDPIVENTHASMDAPPSEQAEMTIDQTPTMSTAHPSPLEAEATVIPAVSTSDKMAEHTKDTRPEQQSTEAEHVDVPTSLAEEELESPAEEPNPPPATETILKMAVEVDAMEREADETTEQGSADMVLEGTAVESVLAGPDPKPVPVEDTSPATLQAEPAELTVVTETVTTTTVESIERLAPEPEETAASTMDDEISITQTEVRQDGVEQVLSISETIVAKGDAAETTAAIGEASADAAPALQTDAPTLAVTGEVAESLDMGSLKE